MKVNYIQAQTTMGIKIITTRYLSGISQQTSVFKSGVCDIFSALVKHFISTSKDWFDTREATVANRSMPEPIAS